MKEGNINMKNHKSLLFAKMIVDLAKEQYPKTIRVKFEFEPSSQEIKIIEKECRIDYLMDGSAQYAIRWSGARDSGGLQ